MEQAKPSVRPRLTLFGCTILHAFSHAYACMLIPLYLLMVADLRLSGVRSASLIVSVYGVVYCIGSYFAGVLADRMNRRNLLAMGLLLNALAAIGIGLTRDYHALIALAVVGGLAGTLFHPAAGALVPALFPKSPGMAVGLLGAGAGLGFFAGPQYAGWRAQAARWRFGSIADWQKPCVEMGIAGVVIAILFMLFASEAHPPESQLSRRSPMSRRLRGRVLLLASVLGMRDFAGVALLSLGSVYLQRALGRTPAGAGFILGAMTAFSIVANPLAVWLTCGGRRLPSLVAVLVVSGCAMAAVPLWPGSKVLVILCIAQTLALGSYAISDAAMLERVQGDVRGRVYGLFLMIAGTFANTSPWLMGLWTDQFGARGSRQSAYMTAFATIGLVQMLASLGVPIIARLGAARGPAIDPLTEVAPATMEPAL